MKKITVQYDNDLLIKSPFKAFANIDFDKFTNEHARLHYYRFGTKYFELIWFSSIQQTWKKKMQEHNHENNCMLAVSRF